MCKGCYTLVMNRNGSQPSILNPRPSTLNPQPSTHNPQPSTLNPQPCTVNLQPSILNPYLSILNPQPPPSIVNFQSHSVSWGRDWVRDTQRATAVAMGRHPRLGIWSQFLELEVGVVRMILDRV